MPRVRKFLLLKQEEQYLHRTATPTHSVNVHQLSLKDYKMSLDIGSGSSRPYVKYNAKAGRWYINGENGDAEIQPPTFIIDFDNIVYRLFPVPRRSGAGSRP